LWERFLSHGKFLKKGSCGKNLKIVGEVYSPSLAAQSLWSLSLTVRKLHCIRWKKHTTTKTAEKQQKKAEIRRKKRKKKN